MEKTIPEKTVTSTGETKTVYRILFIIAACHLLNDSLQAVVPAMFPIIEESMGLTFTQLGLITFTINMVASVMQPVVGTLTDKHPVPYALPIGLGSSMLGMFGLALTPGFWPLVISVVFIGLGSAIFHPEGSRVVYLAAGNKRGLAQSIFQVGGNSGQALAPVITALILVPLGQKGALWFTLIAGLAVVFLIYIARWYKEQMEVIKEKRKNTTTTSPNKSVSRSIKGAIFILVFLVFARSWYTKAISNFYAFYAIETYQVTIAKSQIYLFIFLAAGAIGTFIGGPLADRFGRRNVILFSLVAASPLTILLPYVGPVIATILLAVIGIVLMSSFSVTVVYAQELVPSKIGTMSGLIIGLAFGMGAIGAVALGSLIDLVGITTTMILASLLPLLGFLTFLLPTDEKVREWYQA
ncbi:MFS transporter, FSR family, fosmidomycin resistance protein [Lentibacillus persicus]|uniref:MFS transporter, FSR family, fosmidomycin resistance protein n=1 Tax=Lentibacillus persicus TaxID=640948 RepID=A0A1I1SDA5_9BACI|nr:MFS transporter [Lentibacillus persicus]SFD44302.1 MFS transporter, FSR family, fosmidomycin resistance protein [Lentibacillus persicus]